MLKALVFQLVESEFPFKPLVSKHQLAPPYNLGEFASEMLYMEAKLKQALR